MNKGESRITGRLPSHRDYPFHFQQPGETPSMHHSSSSLPYLDARLPLSLLLLLWWCFTDSVSSWWTDELVKQVLSSSTISLIFTLFIHSCSKCQQALLNEKKNMNNSQFQQPRIWPPRPPHLQMPHNPHCTRPVWLLLLVVGPLKDRSMSLLAEPSRTTWEKVCSPGSYQRAPSSGLAPGWGSGQGTLIHEVNISSLTYDHELLALRHLGEDQSRTDAPLHREVPDDAVQHLVRMPPGHLPGDASDVCPVWGKTPRQTQKMLERLHFSPGPGNTSASSQSSWCKRTGRGQSGFPCWKYRTPHPR